MNTGRHQALAPKASRIFSAYMNTPLPLLIDFERRTNLGPTFAARLLGLPYVSYAQYRSGLRTLKRCHQLHIEVILLLPQGALQRLIEKEVHGNQPQD